MKNAALGDAIGNTREEFVPSEFFSVTGEVEV